MASVYVHIPFCKQRCSYCDFYSVVDERLKNTFMHVLLHEIQMRANFVPQEPLDTLYIGGGTPSVLSLGQLEQIISSLKFIYGFKEDMEATIEVNPDDISETYLQGLRQIGFNRLSAGVQSFYRDDLKLMNRRHGRGQAIESILMASELGFENISIDLIYGIPGQNLERLQSNLKQAVQLPVTHISAYHLTYETGTPLNAWRIKGKVKPVTESQSVKLYELLTQFLAQQGYQHYEISNFGLPGFYSRHNMNYWLQVPYLGLGPSAHSYNGKVRTWNVSSIQEYIKSIKERHLPLGEEVLDKEARFNDYLLTRLRTSPGISYDVIAERFGMDYLTYIYEFLADYKVNPGLIQFTLDGFHLTEHGFLFADRIISDMMKVD